MPEIKQILEHFAGNQDFAMLSVSLDGQDTAQMLRDLIRDEHIDYPVLHVGGVEGWSDGNFDWTISGVPSAFIIDPQGNIFADVYPEAGLIEVYDWLIDQDRPLPPVGIATSSARNGNQLDVTVQLTSPLHVPLEVDVSVTKMVLAYNPEYDTAGTGEPNYYEYIDVSEQLDLGFTAEFDEWGDATQTLAIPLEPDAAFYSYSIRVIVPGMEHLGDGAGFAIGASDYVNMQEEQPAE